MRLSGGKSLTFSSVSVIGVLFAMILGMIVIVTTLSSDLSNAHAIEAPPSERIVTTHDSAGLEVAQQITKVTGDPTLPARAGDVLQYHVAVTNVSDRAFTAAEPLEFTTNVSGLRSQGHVQGVRAGTNGTSYCGPDAWRTSGNSCRTIPIADDGSASVSTALRIGASYYFNVRVEVGNHFEGDLTFTHDFCLTSPLTIETGAAPICTSFAAVEVEPTYGDIEVTRQLTKISGDTNGPIRAGDVLQYHVAVTNTGTGNWTAHSNSMLDKQLTVTSDLGDLADDAVIVGARQGTNNSNYYCGPTGWNSGNVHCNTLDVLDDEVSHTFSLNAGRSHYFNFRIQVSNTYSGDQHLFNTVTVTGDTHGPDGIIMVTKQAEDTVAVQYPDVSISRQWTKVSGDTEGPIRAGDLLQYHVIVTNTGEGDWTAPSAWAEDKQLTFMSDLGDLADDAVIVGARQGTNNSSYYCGPTGWNSGNVHCNTLPIVDDEVSHTFSLNAGRSHYFNVRVQVSNDYSGDLILENRAVVSGDTQGEQGVVNQVADSTEHVAAQFPDLDVTRQWTKIRGDQDGPIRAGDLLQYHVTVTNTGEGDWTAPSVWAEGKQLTFTSDLGDLADDAVLEGARQGTNNSSYYCGPTGWNSGSVHCNTLPIVDDEISHTFALAAGRSHYFNYRVQITNDYTGDLALNNTVSVFGDAKGSVGVVEKTASTLEHVEAQYPDLEISREWRKVRGDVDGPIRPGDILQLHAMITNPGEGDWTAPQDWAQDKRLTFSSDLSDLADDAVILGARAGTNNSDYYCGPEGWNSGSVHCDSVEVDADQLINHTFALAAGNSHYVNVRLQVSDRFTGDEQLLNTMCVTGDTLSVHGVLTECADEAHTVTTPEPALEISLTGEKRAAGDRDPRPGDIIDYTVNVHNPGEGDWNMPSDWANGSPVSVTMDLADILDDSDWIRGETHNTSIEPENGVLRWEDALAAGRTQQFEFSVRVKNVPDVDHSTRLMLGEVCASGTYRHASGASIPVEVCDGTELPVTEFWEMSKSVMDADGDVIDGDSIVRPGDVLTFVTSAHAAGGWPLARVQLHDALGDALHIGDLMGNVILSIPGETDVALDLDEHFRVVTPQFALMGGDSATITYAIRIPLDAHAGVLHTAAVGEAALDGIGGRDPAVCGSEARPCVTEHRIVHAPPTIEKTVSIDGSAEGGTVAYGSELEYTVTVTNPGPGVWSDEHPLSIRDDLSDVLDNAVTQGATGAEVDVQTSWGSETTTLSPEGDLISWTGAVPAGGVVTLNYTVTVRDTLPPGTNRTIHNEACTGAVGAERACDEVRLVLPALTQVIPETPTSSIACVAESWIDLPVTPGIMYTIDGEVEPGSTIVVTATARPGYALSLPADWVLADDGGSATITIHYPPCDTDGSLFASVSVSIDAGSCTAEPTLDLVETEGVAYEFVGEIARGSTVTVTATADTGYSLRSVSWQHWSISEDRKSATLVVTFPELECDDGGSGWRGISPDYPSWGGPSCEHPDVTPWLELPLTEGLTYEVIEGDVARGSSVTVRVTADDGAALGWQWHWRYSDDRRSATYTVHFASLDGCTPGGGTIDPEDPTPGEGDGEQGGGGAPDDDTGGGIGEPGEQDPGTQPIVIDELPEPGGGVAQCVDDEPVVTDLRVRAVPGVWYDITGEYAPGGTLVLTAYAEDGYRFADMSEWATGHWVITDDRLAAVRTYEFPPVEELCDPWQPTNPDTPTHPDVPGDVGGPGAPDETEEPEGPTAPESPGDAENSPAPSVPGATDPSPTPDTSGVAGDSEQGSANATAPPAPGADGSAVGEEETHGLPATGTPLAVLPSLALGGVALLLLGLTIVMYGARGRGNQ